MKPNSKPSLSNITELKPKVIRNDPSIKDLPTSRKRYLIAVI